MKRAGYSDGGGGGGGGGELWAVCAAHAVLIALTQFERARQMWIVLSLHHVEVFSFTLSMVDFLKLMLS